MHRSGAAMAWNVFKFCTALRGLGSVMILLVLGVVGVTYYTVVLTNYGPALYAGGLDSLIAIVVLILFHSLLVMLLWSYFSVVLTDPGGVPPNWRPAVDEERGEADPLNGSEFSDLQTDSSNQRVRYCRKCNQLKPARCHHCSVCGRCVLKMDHHCVWVVNCVGALNYKYFLLFLFYTFLETTVVTLCLLPHFIAFFSEGEIPGTPGTLATTFLAFVLNLAFALSVLGFLIMHISLVAANTTTIEAYEKKTTPKWRYDLGRKKNFEQVFGTDKLYWFIPAYSEEDLRRIPALQGLEFTTVCKSWLLKIKASTFVQSHLCTTIDSNNQNDAHLTSSSISARSYSKERICYEHHWLRWDSPEFGEYSKLSNPLSFFTPKNKPQELRVTGTCNGLVCLESYYDNSCKERLPALMLWNPSVRKIVKLPRLPGWCDPNDYNYKVYRMYEPLGFGYDPHANDYKVLKIVILRSDWFSFRYSYVVQVYSLAGGSWRRLDASFAPLDLQASGIKRPAFINGCLHMLKCRDDDMYCCTHDWFIAYFNLGTEVFGEIMIPEALQKQRCSISRYGDSLALIKDYDTRDPNNRGCEIWVMKEYGVAESWTYLFNVPVVQNDTYGFRRCGEVVLMEEKDGGQSRMVLFDPKSGNQVKVIGSEDHVYCFMDSFVESSVVLLDHPNAISTK
ncbi:hypothetical protein ACLB2K_072270 [Fragaria x ananassa]